MDSIEKLAALANLSESKCGLNHGPDQECPQAVDYIALKMGYKSNHEDADELLIPVCKECAESLSDDDWTLLYCFECNSSQWIYQPEAKLDYKNVVTREHHHLIGLVGCPKCTGKMSRLYFLD